MKLRTIILVFFIFSFQLYAQTPPEFQWRRINTGFNKGFVKMTFSDSLHGWAMTQYELARTTDGGESWQKQTVPVEGLDLRRILFTSSSTGYIIGEKGLILATKDGGNSWVKQNSGDSDHLLRGLCFLNDSTGWVTGQMDDGTKRGGILLHTTNGGVSWDTLSDRSDGILYFDVHFQDKSTGIVIGSNGWDNMDLMKIFSTTDGGKTLKLINSFGGGQAFELYSIGKDTLWGAGFGFMKSIDRGKSWNTYYTFEMPDSVKALIGFTNLLPIGDGKGYAVISNFGASDETGFYLNYTENSGGNWRIVQIPDGFKPFALAKAGKYLFVTGYDGSIITNKPKSMDVEGKTGSVSSFQLMQNYPNPFNPSTLVSYDIPKGSMVSLKVFDLLGKEVATLVDEYKSAGRYTVQFNASGIPSGIYIYQLRTGEHTSIRKMMLLK